MSRLLFVAVVTRRTRAGILIAALAGAVIAAGLARADGDPASNILLSQNVFYPYGPGISGELQKTLNAETSAAARLHAPLKVALIASPVDLGTIPELFGKPQQYADFLDQEISIVGTRPPLLVVMPSGYGVAGLSREAAAATASLTKPTGSQINDLARAAIAAVRKLAAAAGHPLPTPAAEAGGSTGKLPTTPAFGIVALLAASIATVIVTVRTRVGRSLVNPRLVVALVLVAGGLVWAGARGLAFYGLGPADLAYDLDQPPLLLVAVATWLLYRSSRA